MKNEFKILANGKEYWAHNTVKNAFAYWTQGEVYAAYIAVLDSLGNRLDKKAELVSYNDNVANGELYATYRIFVAGGEFAKEISAIGFAPYEGAELSNECNVSIIASEFEVYGTIYLEVKNKDFAFYPAENPLVQSLLGMRALEDIKIKGASAHLSNSPMIISESAYLDITSQTSIDGGINVTFDSGGYTDFLVYFGDMPCARFNLSYFNAVDTSSVTLMQGGFFTNAISVTQLTADEEISFNSYNTVSALYESGAEQISGFDGYELFCDPLYRYAGLCNGNEYYLIDGETLSVKYGGTYSGDISMCSNGEVVSVQGGEVNFLSSGRSVKVKDGQTVVLYRDGGYDIFVYDTWIFTIYRYETELTEVNLIISVANSTMTRLSDFGVMVKNDATAVFLYNKGIFSDTFAWLKNALSYSVKDGCGYTEGLICSLLSGVNMECDKSSNRFCIKNKELFYIGDGGAIKLKDEFDFDSAAVAGEAAIFLSGGNLTFYRIGIGGTFVSAPAKTYVTHVDKTWNDQSGRITLKIND